MNPTRIHPRTLANLFPCFLNAVCVAALGFLLCSAAAFAQPGTAVWTNRYNGPGNYDDYGNSIAVDGSGNVFVTGGSYGSDILGDYATIKYSSAGVPLWTNRYDGPGNGDDSASAVAVDSSGNVFVTGAHTEAVVLTITRR